MAGSTKESAGRRQRKRTANVAAEQYEKLVVLLKHRPLGQYLASFGPLLGQREELFERAGLVGEKGRRTPRRQRTVRLT